MTKLSINVNKLATLRNARGKNNPDLVESSLKLIQLGAQGITVHPRPDGRHIRFADVYALKQAIDLDSPGLEFNIEGYPSDDFLNMVEDVSPAQVTLVPDPPEAITSNAGWRIREHAELLKKVSSRLKAKKIRSSFFVDPETMDDADYRLLQSLGADRVELYTERFAETFGRDDDGTVLRSYVKAADLARQAGLGINAGHDLSLENLAALIAAIPWIDEVSIGHALVCDALWFGFSETVKRYLQCIASGTQAADNH